MKGVIIEEIIFGCIRGLDGKIPDCKLAMHAKCFNEIRKNMLYNLDSKHDSARNGKSLTTLERLKSCCHHSPRDFCVLKDGAWWKLKR